MRFRRLFPALTLLVSAPLASAAPAATVQLAAASHVLWLKADGSIWASGEQNDGARGDADEALRRRFAPIPSLVDVIEIELRDNTSAALASDGSVWVWGMFSYLEPYERPKRLGGLSGVRTIALGDNFVLALLRDGTVWVAGAGDYGLSDGARGLEKRGKRVPALSDVVAVDATSWTAFAVKADGSVWAWGNAFGGLLGPGKKWSILEGTELHVEQPIAVKGLKEVTSLAAGERHVLALTREGAVYAWGDNEDGALGVPLRLGLGDTAYQPLERIAGLPKIVAVAAGYDFSLALDADGRVWSWGNNTYGTLGVRGEQEETRFQPKPVPGIERAVSIHGGHYHAFAVLADGRVLAWGTNDHDFVPLVEQGPNGWMPPTPLEWSTRR